MTKTLENLIKEKFLALHESKQYKILEIFGGDCFEDIKENLIHQYYSGNLERV